MKKLFVFLAAAVWLAGCGHPHTSYNIQGKINTPVLNGKTVYLYQQNKTGGFDQIDSTRIENNIFTFTGSQDSTQLAICLFARRENIPFHPLVFALENGNIKVILDTIPAVSGTELNDKLQGYFNRIHLCDQQLNQLQARFTRLSSDTASDQALKTDIQKRGQAVLKQSENETVDFIRANLNNIAGAYVFSINAGILDEQAASALLDSAGYAFRSNPGVKPLLNQIENKKRVRPGNPFVDLKMKNPKGVETALSDYAAKEKFLIVDFWASWCPPCHEQIPALMEIVKEYRERNVEVVGVSMDYSQQAWDQAIRELNIPWPQMSDLKGWQSQAVDLYGIATIPQLMLLDGEGKIIATGLDIEKLKEKLAELLP